MDYSEMVTRLRSYVSDVATKNKLNMSQDVLLDADYQDSIKSAAGEWNTTPPLGIATIPDPVVNGMAEDIWAMFIKGAACFAIDILTSRDVQNALQYSDKGGVNVSEFGKDQNWRILRDSYWADYQTAKLNYKKFLNTKTFWG